MSERNCYCGSLSREFLEEHGIPEGYCGICEVCGAPGHTRHYPGARPYTGAWCDACFNRIGMRGQLTSLLAIALIALIVYWVAR